MLLTSATRKRLSRVTLINRTFIAIALSLSTRIASAEITPTGSYSTSIPIDIPAFHGISPSLSIDYNSRNSNGMLGVGWQLGGLSDIHVASSTGGVSQNQPTDKFSLDGVELIPCTGAAIDSSVAKSPSCKYALPKPLVAYTSLAARGESRE